VDKIKQGEKVRFKPTIKQCVVCGSEFLSRKSNQIYCKQRCNGWATYHRHKTSISLVNKRRYHKELKNNNNFLLKRKIYRKKYYHAEKNQERILIKRKEEKKIRKKWDKKYRMTDKCKTTQKKYNHTYKGKVCAYNQRMKRKDNLKKVVNHFSGLEWFLKVYKTHGFCPICDKHIGVDNLTLDHIIPISKAPNEFIYTINDVQPLCKSCNSRKNNKMVVT